MVDRMAVSSAVPHLAHKLSMTHASSVASATYAARSRGIMNFGVMIAVSAELEDSHSTEIIRENSMVDKVVGCDADI